MAKRDEAQPIEITSRGRVMFPQAVYTKGQIADYYAAIAPVMLPFAAGRPISLVRCPQGQGKPCFFQKHDKGAFGPAVHHVPITEKDGASGDYLYIDDAAGLLACVQMGTIEFHGWGCHAQAVEKPDRLVFDLDPGDGVSFAQVGQAACAIRDRLAQGKLASFAMLTGGKGVHVVVPLKPGHSWKDHGAFAKQLATSLAEKEPDRFTASMSKARRKGRIFIDYLRNQRGNSAVLPFSVRARTGAPVAAPIAWAELPEMPHAHVFSIGDSRKLLRRARMQALVGWGQADQRLLPD